MAVVLALLRVALHACGRFVDHGEHEFGTLESSVYTTWMNRRLYVSVESQKSVSLQFDVKADDEV